MKQKLVSRIGLIVLAGASAPAFAAGPDGAALFKQRCAACHADVAGKASAMGPNLAGVGNRKAGSATFQYSPALKASGLVWTKANLDKFLVAPAKLVPGTRMVISVPDAAQRKAIVDYLSKRK